MSANLWHSAAGHDRTIEALLASDADIIGLIEATPAWRPALAPLYAKYPYRIDCFDRDPECQTMLLSKLPIEQPIAGRIWKATPIVAGGVIRWNGRPITVLATHWFRPLLRSDASPWGADDAERSAYLAEGLPVSRQAGQAGLFAKFLDREAPGDLIVMGDLNSAPWSRVQRAFRARTGLDNQAGWAASWPSFLPWPLRLPIDHVLARGHLVVTQVRDRAAHRVRSSPGHRRDRLARLIESSASRVRAQKSRNRRHRTANCAIYAGNRHLCAVPSGVPTESAS